MGEGGGHEEGHPDVVLQLQRTLHEIGDRELTIFLAYDTLLGRTYCRAD